MNIIEPWKIQVAKANILAQVDNLQLMNEMHTLHCLCPRNSQTPYNVTAEEFPALVHFRDEVVRPLALTFIKDVFGVDALELTIDTFAKAFEKGENLDSHLHGNSCLTSVYYPEDSKAGMSLFDPRFNASRGYPRKVRDVHFGEYYVAPRAGDLWLMPSYIQHSVEPNGEEIRLSLINDFHFKA